MPQLLSKRELAAILAALRMYRHAVCVDGLPNVGEYEPLMPEEIDTLCDKISLGQSVASIRESLAKN